MAAAAAADGDDVADDVADELHRGGSGGGSNGSSGILRRFSRESFPVTTGELSAEGK